MKRCASLRHGSALGLNRVAVATTDRDAAQTQFVIHTIMASGSIIVPLQSNRPHPSVKDIILDMDSLTISNANSKVGDTPVRTIIMGEAYLERKESGKSQRFLCLIGAKGKVQLTFFTPIVKQPRSEDD
jgi:hypothetical protein